MREMKDSGIEWIGEIPDTWNICRIKQVSVGITDGTHGTFQRVANGRLLLSAKNVFEDGLHVSNNESMISEEDYSNIVSNGFPRRNDVLLCCVGTIGRCGIFENDEPIAFQRSVIFIRCSQQMIPRYMKYSLQSPGTLAQERMYINKSAQEGIYQGSVRELKITLPSLDEQYKICNYLDSKCSKIDAIIARQEEIIEKLKEYKLSVITEAVTKGLNPDVEMKDSEIEWIGKVPYNNQICRLKNLAQISDGTHDTPLYVDKGEDTFPLVTSKCIVNGRINTGLANHISKQDYDEINKRSKVRLFDVIMPMIGTVGNPALVDSSPNFSIKNVALIKTEGNEVLGKYIVYFLNSKVVLQQFDLLNRGGVQNFISQDKLRNLIFIKPQNMDEVVCYLDAESKKIDLLILKKSKIIDKLQEYKKSLIYEVVTGKKEV